MLLVYLSLLNTQEEKTKFEQLYFTYGKLMKYIANKILNDESLAEDAVHNAFIKLTKYLDTIEEIDCHKTKSFIVIIIESVSKDMYRKRKRESVDSLENFDQLLVSPDFSLTKFDFEAIARAIDKLPDTYKQVMLLKYFHDYNNKQISKLLDISEINVRKRLERGRKILAKLLESEEAYCELH